MITPPRVANNTDSEINKALIAFGGLVDTEVQGLTLSITTRVVKIETDTANVWRGTKQGGNIFYAGAADTHTLQPMTVGVVFGGVTYLISTAQISITNAYANYPGSGAWAYITIDYLGVLRLRAATGGGTVRPTNNYFQRSSGGVGYEDINLYGYYYAVGERIVGAIYRASSTTFRYIINGPEMDEEGSWLPTIGGSGTFGAQTYSRQVGFYRRITRGYRAECWAEVVITAKDGAIAGNINVGWPFAGRTLAGHPAVNSPGSVGYSTGITYPAGDTVLVTNWGQGATTTGLYGIGTGVAANLIAVASLAAATDLTYKDQTTF